MNYLPFVDKETSSKILKEYQTFDSLALDLKLIENLRAQDKKLFDHERGAISAINIVNKINANIQKWFKDANNEKSR